MSIWSNETEDKPSEERTFIDQIREIITVGLVNNHGYSFKKVDKERLEDETKKVSKAIKHVATKDIPESNNLVKAASIWVARRKIEGDIKKM